MTMRPAALPGEAGYLGSETEQVDRPFFDIDSDQQASLPLILLQRTNFAAVQHMGLTGRFAHPTGPPVKSRAILTYPYSKPSISLAFGVLSRDFGNDQFPRP